ncbi:MAG: aspartyl protease family protein [Flavobacteriaceae bacterium]|nr:aspartyl protease family protein [Flavobacteriaceae bacterium]
MPKFVKPILLFLFFSFQTAFIFSQDNFFIQGNGRSHGVTFKMINDLMVIPVKVNGSELNFLVDTGVNNTIMFNLSVEDSARLKNMRKIRVRGLGEGSFVNAIRSEGNLFEIGKIVNNQHMTLLIPGKEFDLAARMGVDINGIIGGDIFRDFVIDINYSSKRIKFYNPKFYDYKKCKKCETFDLSFNRGKPYIDIKVKSEGTIVDTKLLIDTGGGKTLWLFDKSSDKIQLPQNYFDDFLGRGLSGNIFGKRSKIDEIIMGSYRFTNANVAYPDSTSVATAYRFKERNGSLGAGILKRFRLLFDYSGKKFSLKKKSSYFDAPFTYNMSGIELLHGGQMLVKSKKDLSGINFGGREDSRGIVQIIYEFVYDFKPIYQIASIRKNSPAEKVGLQPNDVILEVNSKVAYKYKLEEILYLFSRREGRQIKLLIDRDGKKLLYSFRLEDPLK